jgi:SnoaL-like domain
MAADTTTIRDAHGVIDAYFDGVNEECYEDVGRLFAPDGILIAPGISARRGPEAISRYFARALARYPVHHDEPTRRVIAGTTITVEIAFTGALASGAPIEFDAVDVFDLDEEGRIARLVTVYDSHLVRSRLADAEALDEPGADARARAGSLAEATPARTRRALREVRRGTAIGLGAGRWRTLPGAPQPLAARAILLDLASAEEITAAAVSDAFERAAIAPTAGDVLLVRSGGARLALDALPLAGLAALATDGEIDGDPGELAVGERWDLEEAHAACAAAGRRTGLLVSVPGADGSANAAVWL